jgi:hypothetical protein
MMMYALRFVFTVNQCSILALLCLARLCSLETAYAQSSWTTPRMIDSTGPAPQDLPLIAIGAQRQIAIVYREGQNATNISRMIVHRSTNNGATFARSTLPLPQVSEFQMRRPDAIAFDRDQNLFVLWSWDETFTFGIIAAYLTLTKSTDGGATFVNVWDNRQRSSVACHKFVY